VKDSLGTRKRSIELLPLEEVRLKDEESSSPG
jgi:hypothetical protein